MFVDTILRGKGGTVRTLDETGTLADAVSLLNAHNIGAVVITDPNGTVTGILSERDIVRRLDGNAGATLALRIADCMTRGVVTCSPKTEIAEVMEVMTRKRIRHMPVLDNGRMIGIVSIGDVVKYKIEEVEHEAEALKEYIAS